MEGLSSEMFYFLARDRESLMDAIDRGLCQCMWVWTMTHVDQDRIIVEIRRAK